ncbi:MAG: hypothetical protein KIT40_01485 [Nitrospira sp.]|nr:hypothetical protein [Nitrospira sp.]
MATQATFNEPAQAKEWFEAKKAFTTGSMCSGKDYPMVELGGGWRWWKDDGCEIEKGTEEDQPWRG